MQSQGPLISVVIPTFNEEKAIRLLLEDLKRQNIKNIEIIVIDGNSNDKTARIARNYAIVKKIKKRSVGHQRNIGGSIAKGDVIFFIDADTRIKKNFIKNSIMQFKKRNLKIACPHYAIDSKKLIVRTTGHVLSFCFILLQKIIPSGAGPCIIVDRKVFLSEDGFNTELKFQDMEYIRRIGRKYSFGVIHTKIETSDRRFIRDGVMQTVALYAVLSVFFTFGLFKLSNKFDYRMGYFRDYCNELTSD